ncbi:MAG: FAD/NAD(P)-binding protein [Burkholderiaceae bacterium]
MENTETDYLIIGSGAAGLAFGDTLVQETDAHITVVDRHAKPGGHWNDAYPFVSLHQPSAFYGVNSLELGSLRKDTAGANQGLYELASGAQVNGYFDKVMQEKLLPTGRVRYHPMCNYLGVAQQGDQHVARFESLLSGVQTQVTVRKKLVDANYFGPSVPATHTPKFSVAPGVRLVTPNALTQLWQGKTERPRHYAILGAGKTAMDAALWLQGCGVAPEAITWVMPRDSWLVNRLTTQPGAEFFNHSIGGQAAQMECFANATSVDDLFLRLEASGQMLRIYPDHTPSMFHFATMSVGEVEILRRITNVVRMGRVQAIAPDALVLDGGRVAMGAGTLCIDCTASAVEPRPLQPIFQPGKLVLQLVRAPLPTFSAAMIAYVEAHYGNDAQSDALKNRLCGNVPFPHTLADYVRTIQANMANQAQWGQDKTLREWMRNSRLDGFGKLMASVDPGDTEKMTIMGKLRSQAMAAMGNMPRLLSTA